VKGFYGNFLIVVRALTYVLTLGGEGLKEASENAVLNANYMQKLLEKSFDIPFSGFCMHEFVISLENLKKEKGVSALDFAKTLLDYGMHPPTMYFPLIVHEALMVEPTETQSKETLEAAVEVYQKVLTQAIAEPEVLHQAPVKTVIGRPDEVTAARTPIVRYHFEAR
jgi:glycine dehydrogenase subunit 2